MKAAELNLKNYPQPLICDKLQTLQPDIAHGFFTRNGGVSKGIYRSLNAGPGSRDNGKSVDINRSRICQTFGVDQIQPSTVHQCHSTDVVVAEHSWLKDRPRADGIITRIPGLVIGVLTADCGPVLLADGTAGVIGAAHAGWKGAMGGVIENTIDAMINLGAKRNNIVATLGPCISQQNYEVGPEYFATFAAHDKANKRYFRPSARNNHHMFDLACYICDRLIAAGVRSNRLDVCTYGDAAGFFSYRRSVHCKEPDYGRQISAIMTHPRQ